MNSTTKGWIAAILVALLWGTEGSLAVLPLQSVDARILVWLRYMVAFSVLFLAIVVGSFSTKQSGQSRSKLAFNWSNRSDLLKLLLCGLVGQGFFSFFSFLSLDYISISENGVIQGLVPIAILSTGYLFYGERFSALQVFAAGIALVGVTLLVFAPSTGSLGLNIGHLYCVLSIISFASVAHIRANLASKYGAALTMCYQFGFAATGFLIYLLTTEVEIQSVLLLLSHSSELICVLVLGVFVSGIGYIIYIYGIEKIGVNGSSMALNLMPLSAFFIAIIVFDEPVTSTRIIAISMIIAAMMLFAKPKNKVITQQHEVTLESN